jgi:hypothetical protein
MKQNKRELGQYFTVENPFSHPLFKEWMALSGYKDEDVILEPFAGANNILKLMDESGYHNEWKCYDIEPPEENAFPKYKVEYRDTIKEFPEGYKMCVTNCPYLGKSSARRRKIDYPWEEDDLYKVCLNRMLDNCEYVAAIIPESFITADIHQDRLWGVVSLTCKMFSDTDCPVCLAMFTPKGSEETKIYASEEYLGTMEELSSIDLTGDTKYHNWVFNDKEGTIGVKTVDNQKGNDCKFFDGDNIKPDDIKISSRAFTRVSGLPENVDKEEFFSLCNKILEDYRAKTKDVLMTSFKGLRTDGKYRRRLDFRTVRCIMNRALKTIEEKEEG